MKNTNLTEQKPGIFWIASYPKSGNTWVRIFISNIVAGREAALDINKLAVPNFGDRHWWDLQTGWNSSDFHEDVISKMRLDVQDSVARREKSFFKTHDAFVDFSSKTDLFSARASLGAVYIIRNPLDVAISYANHLGESVDYVIDKMCDASAIMADNSSGTRLQMTQALGSWSWHVKSWTERANVPVLIVKYEDMLRKPSETFRWISEFLKLGADSEQLAVAIGNSDFKKLQAQERVSGFKEKPRKCPQFFNNGLSGLGSTRLNRGQIDRLISVHGGVMEKCGYSV